ncbi:MAG: C69 family dipeptidase [Prevotellaceae bacterium]|jgi:dipeptidase|nr:C69 family dipeptidase [Prevotellaceae bacterium]
MKKQSLFLAITMLVVFNWQPATACTNFLVTKGASTDGSTMITYAADSHTLYGELYFWLAAKYPAGTMLKIYEWDSGRYIGEIPQVAQTYRVIGNMNEHSLAIGETTFGGHRKLVDKNGLIDYGSLIYITLQRAKTAREAIKIMAELVNNYGYCSDGESFSIADPNEVWILEMVGKGEKYKTDKKGNKTGENLSKGAVWVAVRIPDGYVSSHANQARIQTFPLANGTNSITSLELDKIFNPEVEIVYAHDVVSVARELGFYEGEDKDFSFSDTYNPLDFGGARGCDARTWSFFKNVNKDMWKYQDYAMGKILDDPKARMPLYIKPDKKISPKQVMDFMRDHYEGTKMDMTQDIGAGPYKIPYRWRPMNFEVDNQKYVNERAIATQQTGFWFVAQSRSWLPNAIGGILWFGVDDAATSCLTPIYCSSTKVPYEYAVGNGDLLTYSSTSAFWIFSRVANSTYLRYDSISADVVKVVNELENRYLDMTATVDEYALKLYNDSPEKAIEYLTDYSVTAASATVNRWKELDTYLLVKYIDGNIKKEKDGKFLRTQTGVPASPNQPALPEFWRRAIVKDVGETLKIIE